MTFDGLRPLRPLLLAAAAFVHCAGATAAVQAQVLDVVAYAPDITVDLGGTAVGAGVLASDDLHGSVTALALPNLPAGARIAAAHRSANGDVLLAFDSTLTLPGGGGIAEPRDLVKFTNATQSYAIQVAGADLNLPTNVAIDAVSVTPSGTILISLDIGVDEFDDDDVIAVSGTNLSVFLDPAAVGIDPALDLDGIDYDGSGDSLLYLSFDGSGTVDGVAFDDEDVLLYDITTQTWSLAYDGSAAAAPWPDAADLTAINVVLAAPPTATPTATSPAPTGDGDGDRNQQPDRGRRHRHGRRHRYGNRARRDRYGDRDRHPDHAGVDPHRHPTTRDATQLHAGHRTGTPTATAPATATITTGPPCVGDCDGSGEVTINELITMVNIALGNSPVSACPAGDANHDGTIAINELVTAVGNAINGCPG